MQHTLTRDVMSDVLRPFSIMQGIVIARSRSMEEGSLNTTVARSNLAQKPTLI